MQQPFYLGFVFLLALTCLQAVPKTGAICKKKQKSLASLNMAKESLNKAKEFYPNCTDSSTSSNSSVCGTREKSFGYLDVALNLISYALQNYPTCNDTEVKKKYEFPMDCSQVLENGYNVSGIYSIWLQNDTSTKIPLDVFCDMNTDSGGWTMIQRRGKYSPQEEFYLDWDAYKKGFGNKTKEFWIGNDNLFALTNQASYSIRFDFEDMKGGKAYAIYQTFRIEEEAKHYKLHIDGYTGDAGDGMTAAHNGKLFSTKDKDFSDSCPKDYYGGWWYGAGGGWRCYGANLNGRYDSNLNWLPFRSYETLRSTQMKLKRI